MKIKKIEVMKPETIEKIRKVLKRAFALWFIIICASFIALIFLSGYGVEIPHLDVIGLAELGTGTIILLLMAIFNWNKLLNFIDN